MINLSYYYGDTNPGETTGDILYKYIMYIAGLRSRYLQYLPPKVTSDLESMGSVTKFLDHKIRSKGIFGLLSPLSITHLHNPARLLCKCYLLGVL